MSRTTFNVDRYYDYQVGRLHDARILDRVQQQAILKAVSELADMVDNGEIGAESKEGIVVAKLNAIGHIIIGR